MINRFLQNLARNADFETLAQSSIRDYYVKGFDYVCLHRSPDLTVKLYFFDGDVSNISEVVNPHDHRYDFDTYVLAGGFTDFTFAEHPDGKVFQRFGYRTPLLGGDGFTWDSEVTLRATRDHTTYAGGTISHRAEDFHTIRIDQPDTVLCLLQFADRPGIEHTWTFMQDQMAPDLSGLYSEFTADGVKNRLKSIGLIDA